MQKLGYALLLALALSACGDKKEASEIEVNNNGSEVKMGEQGISVKDENSNTSVVISPEQGIQVQTPEGNISVDGDAAKQVMGDIQNAMQNSGVSININGHKED